MQKNGSPCLIDNQEFSFPIPYAFIPYTFTAYLVLGLYTLCWVLGIGCWVLGTGFLVLGTGYFVQLATGFWLQGSLYTLCPYTIKSLQLVDVFEELFTWYQVLITGNCYLISQCFIKRFIPLPPTKPAHPPSPPLKPPHKGDKIYRSLSFEVKMANR
jgi:hypothetical protein